MFYKLCLYVLGFQNKRGFAPRERFALTLTSIKSYFSRFIYYIKELKLWIIVILILVL